MDGRLTGTARRTGALVGAGVGLVSAAATVAIVGGPLDTVQGVAAVAAVSFALGWVGALSVYRRLAADADGEPVWNLIPSRRYGGRHAESGGLARAEQERAIEDVREQAEELERPPDE